MRNVINISLPEQTVKEVKKDVKAGGYATTSEFFRHLFRLWKTKQLGEQLRSDRAAFEAGKGREIKSLAEPILGG